MNLTMRPSLYRGGAYNIYDASNEAGRESHVDSVGSSRRVCNRREAYYFLAVASLFVTGAEGDVRGYMSI